MLAAALPLSAAAITPAATYTVTFDPFYGTVSPQTKVVTYGSTYGTLPTPPRGGYEFVMWLNSNGDKITASSVVNIAADHTLTARWTPKQYATYFLPGEGATCKIQAVVLTGAQTYRQVIGSDMPVPVKEDYIFKGWYTKPDGQGGTHYTCDMVIDFDESPTYLYAHWEKLSFPTLTDSSAQYKENVTVKVNMEELPEGYQVKINGNLAVFETSDYYPFNYYAYNIGRVTGNTAVHLQIINTANGHIIDDETVQIIVPNGFFQKLAAFFKVLFQGDGYATDALFGKSS